jgi:hypothetical protein
MKARRIDMHHHVVPRVYREAMVEAGWGDPVPGVRFPDWDARTDIEMMDRCGIRTSVVEISAPGLDFVEGAAAVKLARASNFMPEDNAGATVAGVALYFHGEALAAVDQDNAIRLIPRLGAAEN